MLVNLKANPATACSLDKNTLEEEEQSGDHDQIRGRCHVGQCVNCATRFVQNRRGKRTRNSVLLTKIDISLKRAVRTMILEPIHRQDLVCRRRGHVSLKSGLDRATSDPRSLGLDFPGPPLVRELHMSVVF